MVTPLAHARDASVYIEAAAKGVDMLLVLPDRGEEGDWPADLRRLPLPFRGNSFTQAWVQGLREAVGHFDADLIHVHNEPWAVTTQRMVMTGKPVVVHSVENLYREAPTLYRLRRVNTGYVLRRIAGYLNWGETGLAAARLAGLPSATPQAVIPASPPSEQVFSKVQAEQPDRLLKVAFVGRLVREKGVDTVLEALAHPHRRNSMELMIVGDGPERRRLEFLAQSLGVTATFRGRLDASAAHAAMVQGHVVVVPSRSVPRWTEQWGRSAVEAMMTGRPVLVSDSGELPGLVGSAAGVFPEGDSHALGHRLDAFLADPALVTEWGEAAFERSLAFRPGVLAEQLVAFWDRVLRTRHRDRQP